MNAPSQLALYIPRPNERDPGWASYGNKVIVLDVSMWGIWIITGHICSTVSSHVGVDNIKKTIVWADPRLRMADSADDEHELGLDPKDPNLLKVEEAEVLRDEVEAQKFFDGVYPKETIIRISYALFWLCVPPRKTLAQVVMGR